MLKSGAVVLVVLILIGAAALMAVCPWGAASQAQPASDAIAATDRASAEDPADDPAGQTRGEPLSQREILRRAVDLTRAELVLMRRIAAAEAASDLRRADDLRRERQEIIERRLALYGRAAPAAATTSSN